MRAKLMEFRQPTLSLIKMTLSSGLVTVLLWILKLLFFKALAGGKIFILLRT